LRIRTAPSIALAALLLPVTGLADQILFKNGDRLTGTVKTLTGGKLTFDTAILGKIEVAVSELDTFETDQPIELHLADGTVANERVVGGQAGGASFAASNQSFELDRIEAINPEPVRWRGSLSAGLTVDRGDTESQDARLDFKTQRRWDVHRLKFSAGYEGKREGTSETDKQTTERRYYGRTGYDRFLTKKVFWFLAGDAERDGVADLDLRTITTSGLGYQIFDTSDLSLSVQGGPSWVREDYEDDSRDTDFMAATFLWNFEKKLGDEATLFHDGAWVPSLREFNDNQLLRTETGIRSKLVGSWFGEAKVRWTLDSEPASGKERQDTSYVFGVGWAF
jgi:putative salt-induced outer membrane protein YdiY